MLECHNGLVPLCTGGLERPPAHIRPSICSKKADFVHILAVPCIPTLEFADSWGKLSKPWQKQTGLYMWDLRILFSCLFYANQSSQQQHFRAVKEKHKTEPHRTGNDCITLSAENFMLFHAHCGPGPRDVTEAASYLWELGHLLATCRYCTHLRLGYFILLSH